DSLAYLSKEGMVEAAHAQSEHFCTACFDGNYPVPMDASIKASKLMLEPAGVAATNL
ncbi:MAG: amidophosphoribosyltransferase, partial [Fuerstiella sp.]|nr:amidophosphoribosyltransferase [Fuerstiella sp.]